MRLIQLPWKLPILGQLLKLKKRDFWIYRVGIYDFAQ